MSALPTVAGLGDADMVRLRQQVEGYEKLGKSERARQDRLIGRHERSREQADDATRRLRVAEGEDMRELRRRLADAEDELAERDDREERRLDEQGRYTNDAHRVADRARRERATRELNRMHDRYDHEYAPENDEAYDDEGDRRRTRRSRERTKMRKADDVSHPAADRLRRIADRDDVTDEHAAKIERLADEIDASREDEDLTEVARKAEAIRKDDPSLSGVEAFTRATRELGYRRRAA